MAEVYKSWFEKHRPRTPDDLIFPSTLNGEGKDPEYIKDIFVKFYNNEFIQGNVLSYGPAGFGKTSLNKIMQAKIIKHPNDIFILGRKVEDIDKLQSWLQARALQSKQKLVIIEEIDRLSQQAQVVLKDGPLEKYQHNTAFLATTNNPEKLDNALITRFNYRLHFKDLDEIQTLNRVKKILETENVKYDEELLKSFVKLNLVRGLRELISNLEVNSVTGEFIFDPNKALNLTGNEEYIIQTLEYLFNYLNNLDKAKINEINKNSKSDSHFSQYYEYILKILKEDLLLNYDFIYKKLIDSEYIDFGTKSILIEMYNQIDIVKMKNFHFIATISKIIDLIAQRKDL